MKREFLQNLKVGDQSLPKEVIDMILDAHGKDLEAKEGRIQQLTTQLQSAEENLAGQAFSYLVDGAITAAGGRNAKAISALLDLDTLMNSENQQQAIEEALQTLKKDSRYLFDGEVPPPYARGTGAYHGTQDKNPTTLVGALREKFERK